MAKSHYLHDAAEERKPKKPRFDSRNPSKLAPESNDEDVVLELDEIGKGGLQSKRNAVRLDGYDSDSSNENFDIRADARATEARNATRSKDAETQDEDEDDMFADLEEEHFNDGDDDEELAEAGKRRKKEVRFMDDGDIEGQVSSSKAGGHVSADFSLNEKQIQRNDSGDESSAEGSEADEARDQVEAGMDEELGAGSKKRHAPRLDAFNMRNEAEEGRFDESGNFVRNAVDPNTVHDSWLEGSSKSDMRKAKAAAEKREMERRERARAEDAVSMSETLGALISRMKPEETVLEALQRLAISKPKRKPNWQKNKRGKATPMDVDKAPESTEEATRKADVEAITAAADRLLTQGQSDIYDHERALLQRQYRQETGEAWVDATPQAPLGAGSKQWEYRWSDGRDGEELHGPYEETTMVSWNEAGYFGEGVEFREVGTDTWRESVPFE